jgi:predicted phage baseplate assembly protein
MPLPEPILDDLRFQTDLVDEARRRIIRYCPEWTDYNLSDPGITLIELFAWMTELITYRLNLVPEKNYMRFLDLLGMQLQPASSARVELTFRLSVPLPIAPEDDTVAVVPQGTQVATRASGEEEEVIFTTDEKLVIVPPVLTQLRRGQAEEFNKNYVPRLGVETFYTFSRKPQMGDTFYIGFDENRNIAGHILRLNFECEETQATGVRRADPPWVWECSMGDGNWQEIPPSTVAGEKDTTGGLNNERGALVLYLPLGMKPDQVYGRSALWIRCRLEQRHKEQGMYTQSPRIKHVQAFSLGATTTATHAVIIRDELLGISNGDPGQLFHLKNAPVLALREGEAVQVEETREGETVLAPWEYVPDLAGSDRHDRHFCLDSATGEVSFGPAIRQSDGTVRQYGRVPEAGRQIVFAQYRYGGGTAGNVPVGKIQVLKTALPYIDRVTNLRRAEGGRDAETLEEAKLRARRELRAQERAVTADDYEILAKGASRSLARVKCIAPNPKTSNLPPGMVELLVVPAAFDALRAGDLSKLFVDPDLMRLIEAHLDKYRLLTTTVRIREPNYVGVKVAVEVVASEYSQPEVVRGRVAESLKTFLSPLAIGNGDEAHNDFVGPDWDGWPFGRALFVSEIYSLIQKIPGVKHVLDVKLYRRPVIPSKEKLIAAGEEPPDQENVEAQAQAPAESELTEVGQKRIDVPADTLLCSLNHQVNLVEL